MTRPFARALGAFALVSAAACASGGGGAEQAEFDPSLPIACINIDNRQGSGTMQRIFLVESSRRSGGGSSGDFVTPRQLGEGERIGDARVGQVTRFCTQRAAMPGSYFLRIERPTSDRIDPAQNQNQALVQETSDIVLEPGDLWTWDVRRDRWSCQPNAASPGGLC